MAEGMGISECTDAAMDLLEEESMAEWWQSAVSQQLNSSHRVLIGAAMTQQGLVTASSRKG
jgi:hypothetical protein